MELEWLRKSMSLSYARELGKLLGQHYQVLNISSQWALLCLPRSRLYYHATAERKSAPLTIVRIDDLHLEDPRSGNSRMVV